MKISVVITTLVLFWSATCFAQTTRVTVVRPERKVIRQLVEQPASLEALESTPIYSKVAGYVERVAVDMGDRVKGPEYGKSDELVKPGQMLAKLSLPELVQDVEQKKAAIIEAQAIVDQSYAAVRVSEAKAASARTQIASTEAGIRGAAASVERYQSEYERLKRLVAQQAIAPKLLDEALETLKSAQATQDAVRAQLDAANAAVREAESQIAKSQADRAAADARVKVAEAALLQSQTMLDYATIRAPFGGVVSRRSVHTGHFVQPAGQGAPLFEITRVDTIRVFIDVPESFAALVDTGDPVTIRFPSAPVPPIDDKITRISWTLDRATRTLKAEVDVTNKEGKLRPGMYAYATIVAAEHKEALVLPASAIISDKLATFCACVEGGQVVRKEVTVGLRSGNEVEIIKGLTGTEQVVRANSAGLANGQAVEVAAPVANKP